MWRWLWDSKHGVKKEHRQLLMRLFKDAMYAVSQDTHESAVDCLMQNSVATGYTKFIR